MLENQKEEISLLGLTLGHSSQQAAMFLKGYVLGFLGIPFRNECCLNIMRRMDEYRTLCDKGDISLKVFVNVVNAAILAVSSHHNKPTKQQAFAETAKVFLENLAYLVLMITENPQIYENQSCETYANSTYSQFHIDPSFDEEYNECSICNIQLNPDSCYELECGHIFHHDCFSQHVRANIQDRQQTIACPQQNCNLGIRQEILTSILPPELKQRYLDLILSKYIESNKQTTSCCLTPDCPVVFQYDKSINLFHCYSCDKSYCLNCKSTAHKDMSCDQNREIMNLDQQSRSFVNYARGAKIKQCPKCHFWVQRTFGCPTMTCRCSQIFCYNCGGTNCPHGKCLFNS